MARPNKQKIDHENLRDWLVAHPSEAGQVLRKIEETATETMKKYLQRYFQDGESIGAIAEAEGVEPSTVSHGIAKALERAGGGGSWQICRSGRYRGRRRTRYRRRKNVTFT